MFDRSERCPSKCENWDRHHSRRGGEMLATTTMFLGAEGLISRERQAIGVTSCEENTTSLCVCSLRKKISDFGGLKQC